MTTGAAISVIIRGVLHNVQHRMDPAEGWFTFCGGILSFVVLSLVKTESGPTLT